MKEVTPKEFSWEKQNPLYDWKPVPTCMGVISQSNHKTRERSKESLRKVVWHRVEGMMIDAIVAGSDDDEYMLWVDFVANKMACECKAFEYRSGPCKHVIAAILRGIRKQEGGTELDWLNSAVIESRNAETNRTRKKRERQPSFAEGIAQAHGCTVETRKVGRRAVTGYVLDNDKLWTGPLPVPEKGEEVLVHLPTGETVNGEVLSPYDGHEEYHGLKVHVPKTPDNYKSNRITAFGTEIERPQPDNRGDGDE